MQSHVQGQPVPSSLVTHRTMRSLPAIGITHQCRRATSTALSNKPLPLLRTFAFIELARSA